jgi:putative ABC transport system substrate-binding protein
MARKISILNMVRVIVIGSLPTVCLFSLAGCKVQQPEVFKVGLLNCNKQHVPIMDGFRAGMVSEGFVEGKNIAFIGESYIECEDADAALESIVSGKADLVLVSGAPLAWKAQKATAATKTPIVFAPVYSAVELGIARNLNRPGGNMTGIQAGGSIGKALEWHKAILPATKRVYVPHKYDDPISGRSLEDLKKAAAHLKISVVPAKVGSLPELRKTLDSIPAGFDAIWLLNSNFLLTNAEEYARASRKHRLPVSGAGFSSMGILLSYGPKQTSIGHQASRLAGKILRGTPAGDVPIETAEFHLRINLKNARELGITVPEEVLSMAGEIIR